MIESNPALYVNVIDDMSRKVLSLVTTPLDNPFIYHRHYLISNSTEVKFSNQKWEFRPDIFCLEHYDRPYLYPVVLIANGLKSIIEFTADNLPYIKAPTEDAINHIINIFD